MKKIALVLLIVLTAFSGFSQTDVYLQINHKLGNDNFALNIERSQGGYVFKYTRLQYYISSIVITHDGGMQTPVDKYILADASSPLNELLGNFNITTIEKIGLVIGVDAAVNHSDPSRYISTHPLSPKFPSMHWGWSSGYRFIAVEGKAGISSSNQSFELHGLWDENYLGFSINTAGTSNANGLVIELKADYEQAIKWVDVTSGIVSHGLNREDKRALSNFQYDVFSSAIPGEELNKSIVTNAILAVDDVAQENITFKIYPNPVKRNQVVSFDVTAKDKDIDVQILDITGKVLLNQPLPNDNQLMLDLKSGVYLVSLKNNKGTFKTEKLIILK